MMGHFVAQREKLHPNLLGLHVQGGNWVTDSNIRQLTAGFFSKSAGYAAATGRAVGVIGGRLRLQAYTLSIIDGFYLVAWACVAGLVLVFLLRRSPLNYGDLSAIQEQMHPQQAPSASTKLFNWPCSTITLFGSRHFTWKKNSTPKKLPEAPTCRY